MVKRGKNITRIPKIEFGNNSIEYKKEIKYLGLIIDRNFSRNFHLNYLKNKVYRIFL